MTLYSDCEAYLAGTGNGWTAAQITPAFNAERAAQARVCRVPVERTATVTTVAASLTVTAAVGTFSPKDVGAEISGTGIPVGAVVGWYVSDTEVTLSLAATASGSVSAVLRLPDLAEALFRRVAHNLAVRALPLGVQANIAEAAVATTRVGGTDAEVRRLEAPHRRMTVG